METQTPDNALIFSKAIELFKDEILLPAEGEERAIVVRSESGLLLSDGSCLIKVFKASAQALLTKGVIESLKAIKTRENLKEKDSIALLEAILEIPPGSTPMRPAFVASVADGWPNPAICPACNGRGEVSYTFKYTCPTRGEVETEIDDVCPRCGGTGREAMTLRINGVLFDAKYLAAVSPLPGFEIYSAQKNKPLYFRFDSGLGCVMPINED